MEILHVPVLVNEVLEKLNLKKGDIVVDCTVGEGGHSVELLKTIGPSGFLYGIDQDSKALEKANRRLSSLGNNFRLINDNFSHIEFIHEKCKIPPVQGILADLGISSLQLYYSDRGFSFMKDGPLDMRMNLSSELTAAEVVNSFSEVDLANIIYEFGEERFSRKIAKAIVEYRKRKKITSTKELAGIITDIYPKKHWKIHPATKTFQAFRIFVNGELDSLKNFLKYAPNLLKREGRISIISYHSLEDRLVKRAFRNDIRLKRINKKVIIPDKAEIYANRRARSAKLRVAEKL
jgi:16S rRNA (cytosine1402-N4)-methyltransferase